MSQRSKRHLNRAQQRRRRQLKQKKDRIESREAIGSQSKKVTPEPFYQKYFLEFLIVLLVIFGFVIYRSLNSGGKVFIQTEQSPASELLDRSYDWEFKYPYGYKILALTDTEIIHTSYDTLPRELKINWKNITISKIEANQLTEQTESVRFEISDIHYPSQNVSGMSISTRISKYKGAKSRLARFGALDFMVEIIEETDRHLFCILGLKKR